MQPSKLGGVTRLARELFSTSQRGRVYAARLASRTRGPEPVAARTVGPHAIRKLRTEAAAAWGGRLILGMARLRALLAHPLVAGVLALVIFAAVASFLSWLSTGSFTRVFAMVPLWGWALVALLAFLAFAVVLVVARIRGQGSKSGTSVLVSRIRVGGAFDDYTSRWAVFTGPFRDVLWRYRGRAIEGSGSADKPDVDPDSIEVESPPLCPKCLTGLIEAKGMFRDSWRCVGCGWRRGSSERFATITPLAELYFQGRGDATSMNAA